MQKLRINTNEKGFTLIELMIVIAIIGILAAIAIPNFIAYRDKAFCSSAESDANAILSAMSDFYSIPSHISLNTAGVPIDTAAGSEVIYTDPVNGAQSQLFPALSGSNTATILGSVNNMYVMVQDASGRCPLDYREAAPEGSSAVDGWTHGNSGTMYYYKGLR